MSEQVDVKVECELREYVAQKYTVVKEFTDLQGKKHKPGQIVEPKHFNEKLYFQNLAMYKALVAQ